MEDETREKQSAEAEEKSAPDGSVVYEAIKKEGESELERLTSSLTWSGLAAGLSMGFSLVGKAVMRHHLPEAEWTPLVANFGYCFGFLIVILGRQQLFTENTLTVILPLLVKKQLAILGNIARLWIVVFLANLAGAFLFSWAMANTDAMDSTYKTAMHTLGEEAMAHGFGTTFLRAIFAGWLIALMVWLLPFAQQFRVVIIILITWLVGVSHFPHVVAGSVDVFYLAAEGSRSLGEILSKFIMPTLLGNTLGGVTLVAILGHLQHAAKNQAVDA